MSLLGVIANITLSKSTWNNFYHPYCSWVMSNFFPLVQLLSLRGEWWGAWTIFRKKLLGSRSVGLLGLALVCFLILMQMSFADNFFDFIFQSNTLICVMCSILMVLAVFFGIWHFDCWVFLLKWIEGFYCFDIIHNLPKGSIQSV